MIRVTCPSCSTVHHLDSSMTEQSFVCRCGTRLQLRLKRGTVQTSRNTGAASSSGHRACDGATPSRRRDQYVVQETKGPFSGFLVGFLVCLVGFLCLLAICVGLAVLARPREQPGAAADRAETTVSFSDHATPKPIEPVHGPLPPQPVDDIVVPPPESRAKLVWSAEDLWRAYQHDPDRVTRRLEGRRITVFGVICVDCVPSPFPNQIEELMGNHPGVIFRRERDRDLDGVEVDIVSRAWDHSVNHRGQTARFRGTFFPQVSFRLRQFNPAEKKRPFLTEAVPVP